MRRRRPLRRRLLRALLGALLVVVALGAAAAGLAYWETRAIVRELQAGEKRAVVEAARVQLERVPRRPAVEGAAPEPEAQTILVIGSDERRGRPTEINSDAILLVRLDPDRKRVGILSVPRDLLVEIPGRGSDRINTAYRDGGPALLIATLREHLGVTIDHFVEVDFGGFTGLVSAVGGVYLPIDQRYFNENLGTPATNFAEIDLKPGYQKVSGRDALAFVRYRHGDSDLIRAARQQLFLREVLRQVLATEAYDVLRLRRLLRAFARATTSDIDDVGELWRIVDVLRETPASRVRRSTIPARELVIGGAYYVDAPQATVDRAVGRWLGRRQPQPERAARPEPEDAPAPTATPPPPVELVPDGGAARRLLGRTGRVPPCVPTALPPGYRWPDGGAARAYRLEGEPTVAATATRGSGRSLLWTWTRWDDPPALADPTSTLEEGGRSYRLFFENRRLRQIAWRLGDWQVWLTNTLANELSIRQLVALAGSCR